MEKSTPNGGVGEGSGLGNVQGTAALAERVGVSRWTVSRVLNGHGGVKAATRERVLRAVEELGFEPNVMARGLRGVPSRLVGVSFPHLEALVLARKSQVMQRELKAAGYRGIFGMPEGDAVVEEEVVRHFLAIGVDGVVLLGSTLASGSGIWAEAWERGVGVVAVDPREAVPVSRVWLDRHGAMEMKLKHLVELGHRRIAVLGLRSDDLYGAVRLRGLRKAAKALSLEEGKHYWFMDDDRYALQDYRYGVELARRVMAGGGERPTALFCLNDRLAMGALRCLQDAGKRVPEELSVIGFDNTPETEWARPSLTTVDQNIEEMMRTAAEILWTSMAEKRVIKRKVAARLVVRESTGVAKI